MLSLIVLEAGDPVPPGGEDNYMPLTSGSFFVHALVVLNVAGIASVVRLVLGALFGLLLAPLVRAMRARPRALAATVFIVVVSGGLPLLRDVDLGSTLTRVEQVVLHAVLPSAMAGAGAVWHVLRAARRGLDRQPPGGARRPADFGVVPADAGPPAPEHACPLLRAGEA